MTTNERDFDRLARAWLELGPNEAPERSIAAVLQAIETTPQVRRPWRWPTWRASTMSRITILAVLAGTIAIIVGGLVLSGGTPSGPAPTAVPSPAQAAVTASAGPTTLPTALRGGWVAPSRGTTIENLTVGPGDALGGNSAVSTVVFVDAEDDPAEAEFWLDRRGTPLLLSSVTEASPGVVRLAMRTSADPNCVGRDSGTYRWSTTADGQWLTLELIEDACETRGEILAGTWQRSIAHDNAGGPGIAAGLEPFLTFTLPPATYLGQGLGGRDSVVIDRADDGMSFKVWKDLDGFLDPCDLSKGRLLIEPGMDAFLAYLREDPRFTVTEEQEFEIDGRRAVRVDFQLGANLSEPCWDFDGDSTDKTGVLLWVPGAEGNQDFFWNGELDSPGTIVVTEVDGATLAFESVLVEPNGELSTDFSLLDTVRFHDVLPQPPAG